MKGRSVWSFLLPPTPCAEFAQGGVHTLQWNGCQGHVFTGQLSEDYSWAGSLAPNPSDLAGLGWAGASARTAVLQPPSWAQPAWQRTPP